MLLAELSNVNNCCIVCRSAAFRVKSMNNGFDIFKCINCKCEFCQPMPTQDQFDTFYADYTDPRAVKETLILNAKQNIQTLKRYGLNRYSRLLDYGSGQGFFCKIGRSKNWVNYDCYTKHCDGFLLVDKTYDWITLWGVLEHIPDPLRLLTKIKQLLGLKGLLSLTTVISESAIPYQHKPPEHVIYWTRAAIELLFTQVGFKLLEYRQYYMWQKADIYLSRLLSRIPKKYQKKIFHKMPDMVYVPTNEAFVVGGLTQ